MTYNGKSLAVNVKVTLDAAGRLTAWFTTNDTETGLPPEVLYGFLPPEDGTGRGQGHISYLIRPKTGLADGTEIRNIATIVFDFSTSIDTNQVDPHDKSKGTDPAKEAMVTVDKSLPTSAVAALPATSSASFTVRWSGSDPVAGIARYSIYVQDNGGAFTAWIKNTTEHHGPLHGHRGTHLRFLLHRHRQCRQRREVQEHGRHFNQDRRLLHTCTSRAWSTTPRNGRGLP